MKQFKIIEVNSLTNIKENNVFIVKANDINEVKKILEIEECILIDKKVYQVKDSSIFIIECKFI